MSARTKARKRALDILYESELRGLALDGTLRERAVAREAEGVPVNPYTVQLVEGVVAHQPQIDACLQEHAVDWTLARMPAVDRNLLRLGVFEILHVADVPDAVAISEAVQLARQLSTDESPPFVNGLLARIVERKSSTTTS